MPAWFCAGVVRSCGQQACVSGQPPNPPFQPTAARARSFAFWQLVAMRLRRLNGNPLGRGIDTIPNPQPFRSDFFTKLYTSYGCGSGGGVLSFA
jgi:hypothetical protein